MVRQKAWLISAVWSNAFAWEGGVISCVQWGVRLSVIVLHLWGRFDISKAVREEEKWRAWFVMWRTETESVVECKKKRSSLKLLSLEQVMLLCLRSFCSVLLTLRGSLNILSRWITLHLKGKWMEIKLVHNAWAALPSTGQSGICCVQTM